MAPGSTGVSVSALQEMGVGASSKDVEALGAYLTLLDKWNAVYNITSVTPKSKWVSTHLYDSCSIISLLPEGPLLDIGTGGGFPGLPIAILQPQREVFLLDRSHKKTAFLRQAIIELGIKNVTVETTRIERYQPDARFSVIVSRAFSELRLFVQMASKFCKPDGVMVAMKGQYPTAELEGIPAALVRKITRLQVPQLGAERHAVELSPEV
ncbi:MAG: 16S rRNA (guanine(527)-N(7))-methyltransferase RsmG [Burkholderiales bacterium]|jgi:16S rRNA (guanine527-N7)-methyltransferase|tara:strand:+ start:10833 stop:11462 length:630 start_codon:yes stop_codon:yes gene_type:complete